MNKNEFIGEIMTKTQISKKDVVAVVDAMSEVITSALVNGQQVILSGVGSLDVKSRAARQGINPKTKEKITIAATKAVAFKAAKALKDAVNK
jgi:DNA-binding protein HU-beta